MTIQQMLSGLFAMGFSQKAIAEKVDTTQPTIHRASKGAGVRYETGKAIETLYEEAIQKTAA